MSRDHHVYTVPPPRLERLVHGERWVAARVRPGTAQPHEQARVVLAMAKSVCQKSLASIMIDACSGSDCGGTSSRI